MVINIVDDNPGDALTCVGAMEYLAKTAGEQVYFDGSLTVLPPDNYGMTDLSEVPAGNSFHRVVTLSTKALAKSSFKRYHPAIGHYAYLGLPVPTVIPHPSVSIKQPNSGLKPEILIAPWDRNPLKMASLELISALIKQFPSNAVGILCSRQDIRMWEDVLYIDNCHLSEVAGYMKQAKCVITIDNEYSRLAQLYSHQFSNHVLLCSDVSEEHWSTYPEAKVLYGNPNSWNLDNILKEAKSLPEFSLE